MYFNIGQYPLLRTKAKVDQLRIVTTALRKYDKWSRLRFWFVVVLLLGISIGRNYFFARMPFITSNGWLVPIACCLAFYLYLLWDINVPTFKAVQTYVLEQQ